jgi:hypothetical protein
LFNVPTDTFILIGGREETEVWSSDVFPMRDDFFVIAVLKGAIRDNKDPRAVRMFGFQVTTFPEGVIEVVVK